MNVVAVIFFLVFLAFLPRTNAVSGVIRMVPTRWAVANDQGWQTPFQWPPAYTGVWFSPVNPLGAGAYCWNNTDALSELDTERGYLMSVGGEPWDPTAATTANITTQYWHAPPLELSGFVVLPFDLGSGNDYPLQNLSWTPGIAVTGVTVRVARRVQRIYAPAAVQFADEGVELWSSIPTTVMYQKRTTPDAGTPTSTRVFQVVEYDFGGFAWDDSVRLTDDVATQKFALRFRYRYGLDRQPTMNTYLGELGCVQVLVYVASTTQPRWTLTPVTPSPTAAATTTTVSTTTTLANTTNATLSRTFSNWTIIAEPAEISKNTIIGAAVSSAVFFCGVCVSAFGIVYCMHRRRRRDDQSNDANDDKKKKKKMQKITKSAWPWKTTRPTTGGTQGSTSEDLSADSGSKIHLVLHQPSIPPQPHRYDSVQASQLQRSTPGTPTVEHLSDRYRELPVTASESVENDAAVTSEYGQLTTSAATTRPRRLSSSGATRQRNRYMATSDIVPSNTTTAGVGYTLPPQPTATSLPSSGAANPHYATAAQPIV
jgi:hypothetical protein